MTNNKATRVKNHFKPLPNTAWAAGLVRNHLNRGKQTLIGQSPSKGIDFGLTTLPNADQAYSYHDSREPDSRLITKSNRYVSTP